MILHEEFLGLTLKVQSIKGKTGLYQNQMNLVNEIFKNQEIS